MTLIDIKRSINTVLKNKFPAIKIYANEMEEGFKRPSFFTQLIPIASDYETVNIESSSLMIVINYYLKTKTNLEVIETYESLKKAFGMTLKVNDRHLLLRNIRFEEVDGNLQFKFDLEYFIGIEKTDSHLIMQELDTEIIKE